MVMMIIVIMATKEVVKLVSWCFESSQPQKDYIRAEHKLQSISKVFIPQIIMQVFFFFFLSQSTAQILSTISKLKTKKTNICFGAYLYSASTQHG